MQVVRGDCHFQIVSVAISLIIAGVRFSALFTTISHRGHSHFPHECVEFISIAY